MQPALSVHLEVPSDEPAVTGVTVSWKSPCGSQGSEHEPKGSIYTPIVAIGPYNHSKDGLLGHNFHSGSAYGPSG